MRINEDFLKAKLVSPQQENLVTTPGKTSAGIDFFSGDYLGIIRNRLLRNRPTDLHTGAGGNRTSGIDCKLLTDTEDRIATFHDAEAALFFSSGYMANMGVINTVVQKGDSFLYDEYSHPSVKEAATLSKAATTIFQHNNVEDLHSHLKKAGGRIFIYTQAVFESDGSIAPLEKIIAMARQYEAYVIVNESHSIGIFGEKGEGLVYHLGLQDDVFVRIHSFGNTCGSHGAVVLGSTVLKKYLLHFCKQVTNSTALSEQMLSTIWESYKVLPQLWQERTHLQTIIHTFQDAELPCKKLVSYTPIQYLLVPGADIVTLLADELNAAGFVTRAVIYPEVAKESEMLKIVLHSFNTRGEVSWLIQAIHTSLLRLMEKIPAIRINAA